MNGLKKTLTVISSILLPVTLFLLGLLGSANLVFGTPSHLKSSFEKSGIYSSGATDTIKQSSDSQGQKPTGSSGIPVNQTDVQSAIAKAIPPEFVQGQTGAVLDDFYQWLHGDSPKMYFKVDLTQIKANLATNLAAAARSRLVSLPPCPASEIAPPDFDPFNATCLPKGVDINAAVTQVQNNFQNVDFLNQTVYTADDIKLSNGKTLNEQLQGLPRAYHYFLISLYVLLVVSILALVAIICLSNSFKVGLKHAGVILISVGAISSALAWGTSFVLQMVRDKMLHTTQATQPLQLKFLDAAHYLVNDMRNYWLTYGLILLGLGVISLVVSIFVLKTPKPIADTEAPTLVDAQTTLPGNNSEKTSQKSEPTPKK